MRPLDDYSNTYIGLHVVDATLGSGRYKYGEYQYVCNTSAIEAKRCFDQPDHYELFDLVRDPWELENVYNSTSAAIKSALAKRLREYYGCQGTQCP